MSRFNRLGIRFTVASSLAISTLAFLLGPVPSTSAQIGERTVPREIHFVALQAFYAGEYRSAADGFRNAARSGIRSTEGPWIDAICYYSMLGECFYHMGDLAASLEQHEKALQLMLVHKGWMKRMQWPAVVQPAALTNLAWGQNTRQTVPGQFPESVLSLQGTDVERAIRQGGVVAPPELYPVRVMEIMRCIAVSLRRRNEILGPVAASNSLSANLVKSLSTRQVTGNHWINQLVQTQLGLAQAGVGQTDEAMRTLERSLTIGGRIDHPLTGVGLLELGKLALSKKQLDVAARCFFEASFPAASYSQADVLEEALSLGAKTHMLLGAKELYAPLEPTAIWARSRRMQRAEASILLAAARTAAQLDQNQKASALLNQSRRAMGRGDLPGSDLGARWQYQSAVVAFQTGNSRAGNSALKAAMKVRANSLPRSFQTNLTLVGHENRSISPRVAGSLFARLMSEPSDIDWSLDPFDALQFCMSPRQEALETWLEIAIDRNEFDVAVEISDMIRRHKFFQQLPLAGRLVGLRWILFAPEELLDDSARKKRQDLLSRYPGVAELRKPVVGAAGGTEPAAPSRDRVPSST